MGAELSRVERFTPTGIEADERVWFVAYTKPRQEEVAQFNLQLQGFEVYLPWYKTFHKSPNGLTPNWQPMFPRYIFFRPGNARQSISSARSTRGVSFVLSFGSISAVLKPHELQAIQAIENERNHAEFVDLSVLQTGLQVRLQNCGLHGLEGLVQAVSAKRVTLLIELLGRQKTVELEHHQVELI